MGKLLELLQQLQNEPNVLLFLSVSFAYNVSLTAIGSLIRYYTDNYGASFFVLLNVSFYAVGLPTSIIQRALDSYVDYIYDSKYAFRLRVWIFLMIICSLLLTAPVVGKYGMLGVACGIGVFTWASHGSVTSLASVVKSNASAYVQIGFMLPGVYGIVLVITLGLNTGNISTYALYRYYAITAACVVQGIFSWVSAY